MPRQMIVLGTAASLAEQDASLRSVALALPSEPPDEIATLEAVEQVRKLHVLVTRLHALISKLQGENKRCARGRTRRTAALSRPGTCNHSPRSPPYMYQFQAAGRERQGPAGDGNGATVAMYTLTSRGQAVEATSAQLR